MTKLSCQEVLDQLSEYLDDDARADLAAQITSHLDGCSQCKVEVDSIRYTISLYRCHEPVAITLHISEQLRVALDMAYTAKPEPPRRPD